MQNFSESILVGDDMSNYSHQTVTENKVEIQLDLSNCGKDFITGPMISKLCKYWT